eukprot:scaffold41447_cov307-Skeletonema_marinoi.AAC.1
MAMPAVVDREVVTIAEATTDFVLEMTATDFAATHQGDVAVECHRLVVETEQILPICDRLHAGKSGILK